MRYAFASLIGAAGLLGATAGAHAQFFSDDFEDGVIDSEHWTVGGDITESDGVMHLNRDLEEDFLEVDGLVSGEYTLEVDMRLNQILDQSALHGVSIIHDDGSAFGQGLTFGYSVWADALFVGQHSGNQIDYFYGPDGSNDQGEFQHWEFQRDDAGHVTILVDGEQIPNDFIGFLGGDVPDEAQVWFPGHYFSDGGGGETMSDMDNFSLTPAGCPADCNGDGELNITDFVCFQGEWEDQTDFGDCNGDGVYDILDFICYQDTFGAGCP